MNMRAAAAVCLQLCILPLGQCASAAPAPQGPGTVRAEQALAHLEQAISWYRHASPLLTDSQTAAKAVQLAFDFARAEAALPGNGNGGVSGQPANSLQQASARAAERVAKLQAAVRETDAALESAPARSRAILEARRRQIASQLAFAKQVQDTVQRLVTFAGGIASERSASAGLAGQLKRLERSVPEVVRPKPGAAGPAPMPAAPAAADGGARDFHAESAGLFALGAELLTMARAKSELSGVIGETDALLEGNGQLRTPLTTELRAAIRRADSAAAASGSDDPELMAMAERETQVLAARFQQLTAAAIPLREESLILEASRAGLAEARDALAKRAATVRGYLLIRAAGLGIAILLVLLASELWRRLTFRWVRDPRRRRQFLVLRRVASAGAIAIFVFLGFITEIGSIATYAGLLTAGLAVALQNVILSIVAYFFLIGRYGLRVGDRVTISGVTGDVIEIGLVRMYVMELAGAGTEAHPTGRIVFFSNSVLFQPAALFKQLPGTDYVWHTVTLTLAPETDVQLAQTRLMAAVDAVYEEYRESIERQHAAFERSVDVKVSVPHPEGRLRFCDAGLEFSVRYPAELRKASAIDGRVVKALHEAVANEPGLALAGAGTPKVAQPA